MANSEGIIVIKRSWNNPPEFKGLLGKATRRLECMEIGSAETIFTMVDGLKYASDHEQDCRERVLINGVIGDTKDLINRQVTTGEGVMSEQRPGWYVTSRRPSESNGFYSESVDFARIKDIRKV